MFVAALCHDIDHPGHTNAFEINISSELAIMYSDDCVLEHHHAATTFRVLRGGAVDAGAAALNAEAAAKCDCNVLNSLTTAQYHEVRKNICRMILMTDMAKHGDTCRELSLQDQGDFESMSSGDSPQTRRELFMDAILHSADLATQTFRTEFALQWGDRVVAEFKDQARRERELGLPVAAYMDGLEDGDNIPTYKLQLGFCQYVLAPMWSQMERLFPDVFKPVYANLKKNISFYQDEIDAAEVRARSGAIAIGGFSTELDFDTLTINGVQYSGTDAPPNGRALLVSARDGSGVPELTAAISASLEASLGRARQTLRLSVSDGGALGKQLAFLHGHPRIAVVDQRDSDDGAALVVTADMDDETYRTFVGRRWK